MEIFTGTKVQPKVSQDHPFGCPVYALDGRLQNRQKIDKWDPRARLGIYLGNSPMHAKTCGLILSLRTGLVSPQFHIEYDNLFETTRGVQSHDLPSSLWQVAETSNVPLSQNLPQEPDVVNYQKRA
jgi:hypothetical protein